jgi:sigma-B regulation protein RsbU (phosphoserine phosphatase)
MRKGMFVTALYALVDPAQSLVTVACAGHKLPLLRVARSDGKLRAVHPEGLALGFDKGPVFDRRLEVQTFPFEPGDRLVLVNTGTVAVADAKGAELGEKPLFAAVQRFAGHTSAEFLERLRSVLAAHAGSNPFPRDVSIVTIARE